jgi:two-component system C4-dicarboxylate transport response regulator DctD
MTDMSANTVFLVEDDDALRDATAQALELAGLAPQAFPSAARALPRIDPNFAGCVVTDIRMDGMDGLALKAAIHGRDPDIPVILITGHGDVAMAVAALKDGAFDFLAKPFSTDELTAAVRRALQARALVLENRALKREAGLSSEDIVGSSAAIGALRTTVGQLAMLDLDVLIEGEGGTGKEIVARALHRRSKRALMPFVALRCSALEGTPVLDEAIAAAAGGILFLDELDALSLPLQARLLALSENREKSEMTDLPRIVAATRVALEDAVREGRLREDLFYRLSVLRLRVPPLRERREDIAPLFARFVQEALDRTRRKRFDMSAADRRRLLEYDWPGNARELRNYAFGAVLDLRRNDLIANAARPPLAERVAAFERTLIVEALEAAGGSVQRACATLSLSRQALYEKIAKHRIDLDALRQR